MKWIVLSENNPAGLHRLLESAQAHLPHVLPEVIFRWKTEDDLLAYEMVANRLKARWYAPEADAWRQTILHVVGAGKVEALVLFTADTMLFRAKADMREAWSALLDTKVLGLALDLAPGLPHAPTLTAAAWKSQQPSRYVWNWAGCCDGWEDTFAYGTVYRTSDLQGPLYRNQWDSPESLRRALCSDAGLRRRERMACLAEACLTELSLRSENDTARYLAGEVLAGDGWVPYKGE